MKNGRCTKPLCCGGVYALWHDVYAVWHDVDRGGFEAMCGHDVGTDLTRCRCCRRRPFCKLSGTLPPKQWRVRNGVRHVWLMSFEKVLCLRCIWLLVSAHC